MRYIKITMNKPSGNTINFKTPLYLKILSRFFDLFASKQNPDFEGEIKKVEIWLLEFKYNEWNYTDEVNREIGLDSAGNVIVKMPDENNYGFWTDEDVDYEYFKNKFKIQEIPKEYFEKMWNSLH